MPLHRVIRHLSLSALVATAGLALAAPCALAEGDGGGGASSVEKEIQAQAEKIVKLMRANEKALLEASQGSGRKPAGVVVDVEPPAQPGAAGTAPSPAGSPPPGVGDDVKKRLDEALKVTRGPGATIPKELENLVKLIPT